MRIATWNLLHATPIIGTGTEVDLVEQAHKIRADIIGVQEVDREQPRSNHVHQLQDISVGLELPYWIFAPAVIGTPGEQWHAADDSAIHLHSDEISEATSPHYGNGIASRYPLDQIEVMRFKAAPVSLPLAVPSDDGWRMLKVADEPRVAIIARAQTPLGPMTIATTHLSFVPGFNVKQLRALSKAVAKRGLPSLLFGDFNLIGKLPQRITRWDSLAQLPTYPVVNPRIQFDHILAHGLPSETVKSARGRAQRMALGLSDHCALVTQL
jgi:endonuclease/exonuclease/phosphatase family metal-dependent hydrolase